VLITGVTVGSTDIVWVGLVVFVGDGFDRVTDLVKVAVADKWVGAGVIVKGESNGVAWEPDGETIKPSRLADMQPDSSRATSKRYSVFSHFLIMALLQRGLPFAAVAASQSRRAAL